MVAGMVGGWPEAKTVAVEVLVEVGQFARAGVEPTLMAEGGNGAVAAAMWAERWAKAKALAKAKKAGGTGVGSVVLVIR